MMAPEAIPNRHSPSLILPVENNLAPPSPGSVTSSPVEQTQPQPKEQQTTYNDKYVVVYDFAGVGMYGLFRR